MMNLTFAMVAQLAAAVSPSTTYKAAYESHVEKGLPLVVLVGADWCPGCRYMKGTSIPEVQKRGGLNQVAFAVVDTDRDKQLAGRLMRGSSIPQLVMYYTSATGKKRRRLVGAQSPEEIQAFIDRGLAAQRESDGNAKVAAGD